MKKHLLAIALFSIFSTASAFAQTIALRNVDVIPMDREGILENQTVLLKNGKIAQIGAASAVKIPRKARLIDGGGKYLMPGLMDMHAHFFNEQGDLRNTCETELKMMLANGLTHARIMAGHPNYLDAREKVKKGRWPGPGLTVVSPQLVGRWPWPSGFKNYEIVDTPEKAAAAVRRFKQEGYEQIKITFMIDRACYDAIVATAREVGIKVVGHVGPKVKLPAALVAGEQIEHMDEFIDQLLPDTSYNHGQSVSDMNIWRKPAWATVPHLDESKIPALARRVKAAGIYVSPTNYFFITTFGEIWTEEQIKNKPDYDYIPHALREERWKARAAVIVLQNPPESREKYVRIRKNMVEELWKAGVPLMAGSDSPEFFLVTGFSIHDELGMFVASGLTPFAALQTATVNPAAFLGLHAAVGTIAPGKNADLILLDKNPLEDIANTRSIRTVFKNGVAYERNQLDAFLEEAKAVLQK